MHIDVYGSYMGHDFSMKYLKRKEKGKGDFVFNALIDGKPAKMYFKEVKDPGRLLFADIFFDWIVETDNGLYEAWTVGVGDKSIHPLYFNGKPVAHAVKPHTVIDDMHVYQISVYDEDNLEHILAMILEMCFHFIWRPYHPSEVRKGVVKTFCINKSPFIREKISYLNGKY